MKAKVTLLASLLFFSNTAQSQTDLSTPAHSPTVGVVSATATPLPLPSLKLNAPKCKPGLKKGTLCICQVSDLKPTQGAVGYYEVQRKRAKVESFFSSPKKLERYLRDDPNPSVIGPKGEVYIIDGHHLGRALADVGLNEHYCKIEASWEKLSSANFWKQMQERKWIYLFDESGAPLAGADALPKALADMKDDPYRSLAGRVREGGGFKKSKAPFAEFIWANFFRTRLSVPDNERDWPEAIVKGIELAKTSEARGLPGYVGGASNSTSSTP